MSRTRPAMQEKKMVVFLWWCLCGGVSMVVFLWWCFCGGVFVVVFVWWCSWLGGVFVFLWWCFLCSVVVFLWWCFCGVVAVVFLWWCFCGGVCVVVFVCWCFCAGVFVVVFLWWCFCGGVFVVWLRWCSCGGVFVAVFLWWCSCSGVQSTTPAVQSITPYYKVLLRTTKYYSILRTTEHYSDLWNDVRTTSFQYYSVLRQYYKSFQNEHFVRGFCNFSNNKLPKRAFSCEASSKFHRISFQNERFARCFRQFSQKKLPKGSFRARLPPNFTEEASKTSVSRDASSKIHKLPKRAFRAMLHPKFTSFQNERFARCFLQISQNNVPKTRVSRDASDNFHQKFAFRYSFARSTHRFLREGSSAKSKNAPRTTAPCIPKFQHVRFATAACAKMYESIDREPTRFAHTKM